MGALSHLQIVEIGSATAASYCARLFADFGATVQKVEPPQGDPLRRTAPYTPNGQSAWFAFLNFNKSSVALDPNDESASLRLTELIGDCDILIDGRDIDAADCPAFDLAALTLDLTRPQGLHLAKQLLADADLAVDNYSVEVLPKLGLGYDVLSKVNPKLVMMSMSAFGSGSIYRDCRAYGSTLEQGSGLPGVVGDANGPPVMDHTAFGDAVGGLNGCAAVLIALIHARRTGKGQFIDLAQIECMMSFAAPWIVAHSIDGEEPVKYGNRHPDFVPHRCFPCAGSDNWIVVAVSSDAMWPKLARLLGRADWAADQTLRRATGRRQIESKIEDAITDWTSTRDPDEAMNALQAAGVASGVARLPIDLLKDPQLHARGFIQEIDRAFIGRHPQPSMPFRETDKPFAIRNPPPTLGEHNREILAGILGLSSAEIDQLARDGIIGIEMLMEEQLVNEKKRAAG